MGAMILILVLSRNKNVHVSSKGALSCFYSTWIQTDIIILERSIDIDKTRIKRGDCCAHAQWNALHKNDIM